MDFIGHCSKCIEYYLVNKLVTITISSVKMENLYKILQCSETASMQELKKAYQALALKHHPDKAASCTSSQDTFIRINHAWTILRDPRLRNQYDVKWKERCLAQSYPIQDTVHFDEFEEEFDADNIENKMSVSDNGDDKTMGGNCDKTHLIKGDNIDVMDDKITERLEKVCVENITKGDSASGNTGEIPESSPLDDENIFYTYECRCGGNYVLTGVDVKLKFDIVCCDTCSLSIQVIYEDDEDD